MDFGIIAGVSAGVLTLFNIWKGTTEYNKAQREAGAKEERDKQRDAQIKELWNKITEMDTVKKQMFEVSLRLETLEKSIEKLIENLDKLRGI